MLQLEMDIRRVMEPYTATKLKVTILWFIIFNFLLLLPEARRSCMWDKVLFSNLHPRTGMAFQNPLERKPPLTSLNSLTNLLDDYKVQFIYTLIIVVSGFSSYLSYIITLQLNCTLYFKLTGNCTRIHIFLQYMYIEN